MNGELGGEDFVGGLSLRQSSDPQYAGCLGHMASAMAGRHSPYGCQGRLLRQGFRVGLRRRRRFTGHDDGLHDDLAPMPVDHDGTGRPIVTVVSGLARFPAR